MNMPKRGLEGAKSVVQGIVTFFAILSFIFLAILTGLSLLSNSAYKKLQKSAKNIKRQ